MAAIDALAGKVRKPTSGKNPTSAVVLLHGYGSSGDDLIGLAPYFAGALPDTIFYAPHAPSPIEGGMFGGYQWFSLQYYTPDMLREGGMLPAQFFDLTAGEILQSAERLNTFLDQVLAENNLTADRLALVGFSQGTMMSLHVGPRRTQQLAGIVGFSGALMWPEKLQAELKTKPPAVLAHGTADEVVPAEATAAAEKALTAAGISCRVKLIPGMPHSIDESGAAFAAEFLTRVIGSR
jgi:phospholipase/carboxylesterase